MLWPPSNLRCLWLELPVGGEMEGEGMIRHSTGGGRIATRPSLSGTLYSNEWVFFQGKDHVVCVRGLS